ncbi:MAG: FAD-dependent oxidoreductase [Bryobacterales bacterium]|nr:FAD-dependent oxidoreductase [Bryobacteraceae bacterium]MDW8131055.1 FAD-dependent oxidoreductase [Bryobacterales bacterium]
MRLVIVGGVAAGMSAAARARRLDPSLEIVVLERGAHVAWAACGLPFYLSGRVARLDDLILFTPERFQRERGVLVRTGAEVTAIRPARRQVVLRGGEQISYDRLILATGARPRRDIAGAELPHVFTLHTLEDGRRLRSFLDEQRPRRAGVIGAGYIGLEIADALSERGLEVTVWEARPWVLDRQDPELTQLLERRLAERRIELRLGTAVSGIEPGSVQGVPAEVVVIAAGLQPNVELAAEAGIELGRFGAIRVNDRMETNLAGVYAAGDCAETTHVVTGGPVYLPLGTTANKMGRVAGANAAGRRERFGGVAGTLIVALRELAIAVTGLSVAQARQAGFQPVSVRIEAPDRSRYLGSRPTWVELVADRNTSRLLGGSVVGEKGVAGRINVVATALAAGMTLEQFAQLDLAYTPPLAPVRDPLLVAANELNKVLAS